PRGILIFPLENCLKHAKISPKYPVEYTLSIVDGVLRLKCVSYSHHLKIKMYSGTGNVLLKEKLDNCSYTYDVYHYQDDITYEFNLKLIPNYVKKAKIQFALFR